MTDLQLMGYEIYIIHIKQLYSLPNLQACHFRDIFQLTYNRTNLCIIATNRTFTFSIQQLKK